MDAVTAASGAAHGPKPMDFSLCMDCGEWGIFDHKLDLRKPTSDEYDYIASSDVLRKARQSWVEVMGRPKQEPEAKKEHATTLDRLYDEFMEAAGDVFTTAPPMIKHIVKDMFVRGALSTFDVLDEAFKDKDHDGGARRLRAYRSDLRRYLLAVVGGVDDEKHGH